MFIDGVSVATTVVVSDVWVVSMLSGRWVGSGCVRACVRACVVGRQCGEGGSIWCVSGECVVLE